MHVLKNVSKNSTSRQNELLYCTCTHTWLNLIMLEVAFILECKLCGGAANFFQAISDQINQVNRFLEFLFSKLELKEGVITRAQERYKEIYMEQTPLIQADQYSCMWFFEPRGKIFFKNLLYLKVRHSFVRILKDTVQVNINLDVYMNGKDILHIGLVVHTQKELKYVPGQNFLYSLMPSYQNSTTPGGQRKKGRSKKRIFCTQSLAQNTTEGKRKIYKLPHMVQQLKSRKKLITEGSSYLHGIQVGDNPLVILPLMEHIVVVHQGILHVNHWCLFFNLRRNVTKGYSSSIFSNKSFMYQTTVIYSTVIATLKLPNNNLHKM